MMPTAPAPSPTPRPRRRMLLTGGAGFIGTHLAERLVAHSDVVLFDNFRRDSLSAVPTLREHPCVQLMRGDVLDRRALAAAVEGVHTVMHLAAIAGVSSYYAEALRTLQVNILGTANVLEAAVAARVDRFVEFSTSEVFGLDALWVHEDSGFALGPVSERRWVYATSKLAAEHFAIRYGEEHGFGVIVLRPFNVYGPRQTGEGAISNFVAAAVAGRPLEIYGDGNAIRAWCYVSDFVDAVELALATDDALGQTFNIGNPAETETTRGLARRVCEHIPKATVVWKQVERAEVRIRIPNISHARSVLGFAPKVDLDEGLRRTIAWTREGGR